MKTISECLSDAGFSCKSIPNSEHVKLEKGIKDYAIQQSTEILRQKNNLEKLYTDLKEKYEGKAILPNYKGA